MAAAGADKAPVPTLKMIIFGEGRVGKTTLLLKWHGGQFNESTLSTIGVDFKIKLMNVDGQQCRIYAIDTAGQERYRAVPSSTLRGCLGVMYVYDTTSMESFVRVRDWINLAQQEGQGEQFVSVLVATKTDLASERVVPTEEGQKLADSLNMPFFETSSKTGANVESAFMALARLMKRLHETKFGKDAAPPPGGGVKLDAGQVKKGCC